MKLFEPIVVDLYKPFPLKKVDMQQNNIGRGVIVTLTAGSTIVDPSDEDVKLWAERPDGNISYLACTVQADGTIRAPFSSQMLSVPGEVVVSLEMISGEDDITTPIFKVGVGRNIADHTAAESQNEFSALQESISAVNAALAEVKELKEKGLSKVTFSAYADFPEVGNAEMLYVDTTVTDKLMVYRWNGTGYVPAGVDVVDPTLATVLGFAADAKLTGDALSELNKNSIKLKKYNISLKNAQIGNTVYTFDCSALQDKNILAFVPVINYNGYIELTCKMASISSLSDITVHVCNHHTDALTYGELRLYVLYTD